jgi:hypothetical protein
MAAHRWVTVFTGPPLEVELMQGRLEAEGFLAFQPDRLTKTVDPFITGPNPLEVRLQVPDDAASAARALIERLRAANAADDADEGAKGTRRGVGRADRHRKTVGRQRCFGGTTFRSRGERTRFHK